MKAYNFTTIALKDLEEIIDYTSEKWGKAKASEYIDGLEDLAQKLADNPYIGSKQDHLAEGLIAFPYISHVFYYMKKPHGITIIRILHKRMNPLL